MALKRSSFASLLLLALLLLSSTLKGPAGGCMKMAMAEDDDHCHYLDAACNINWECSIQCAAQDYKDGGICVPGISGWHCCCIIDEN